MKQRFFIGFAWVCLIHPSIHAADWPVFRGNALQTGVADGELPEKLEIRWKFETKEGFEGSAVIVGDTVYLACLDSHLYALDLATGKEKWRYKGGPFKTAPGANKGKIFAGDLDGTMHCVDAATGRKHWTHSIGEGVAITSGVNFADDNLLFGSDDENLTCLSPDGKPLWTFKVAGGPVNGTPAVVGNRTFAAGCDSALHTLDTKTGKEVAPAVDLGGQVAASLAVRGDQLYVGTMSYKVLGVDWKKSEVAWRFEPAKRPNQFYSSIAATEDLVIAGCKNKRLYALDRRTGNEVWSFLVNEDLESSPVVVGRRVYVASGAGKLYSLDLAKGNELQRFELGGDVMASPAVGGGCLVIGLANKGLVYCFGGKK